MPQANTQIAKRMHRIVILKSPKEAKLHGNYSEEREAPCPTIGFRATQSPRKTPKAPGKLFLPPLRRGHNAGCFSRPRPGRKVFI